MEQKKLTKYEEAMKILESAIDIAVSKGVYKKEEVITLVQCIKIMNESLKPELPIDKLVEYKGIKNQTYGSNTDPH